MACQAGARPKSRPTKSAAPAQKATRRRSKVSVTAGGSSPSGISDGATCRIAAPSARPSAPPTIDSTRLSVSSCRIRRGRSAPSADRSASSRLRAVARASSRLATLAQQIEEHEGDDAEEEHGGLAQVGADDGGVERLERHAAALVGLRVLLRQRAGHGAQVRVSRRQRHARLQASDRLRRCARRAPAAAHP